MIPSAVIPSLPKGSPSMQSVPALYIINSGINLVMLSLKAESIFSLYKESFVCPFIEISHDIA